MRFFDAIKKGAAGGVRSGKAVKIIEDVLERSLPSEEREKIRKFGEFMNYSDFVDEWGEADNYFRALLFGWENQVEKVKPEIGDWILDCMVREAKWGRYGGSRLNRDKFIESIEKIQEQYKLIEKYEEEGFDLGFLKS